jgi:hypothetical protein
LAQDANAAGPKCPYLEPVALTVWVCGLGIGETISFDRAKLLI